MAFITKEELLSKLLSEIEQLCLNSTIQERSGYEIKLFVPSDCPQYPSYMIGIGKKWPKWMLGDAPSNYIVVNVSFFEKDNSTKGRTSAIDPNELSAKNHDLQEAMDVLVDEVFDESGGHDVSLYPTELEARKTLREIMYVEEDDEEEVEYTPLDKEEISSLVDDLFEATMEDQ